MSARPTYTVFCDEDGCLFWEDEGVADTAREARARLKRRGWLVGVSDPHSRVRLDYCPRHAVRKAPCK